MTMRPVIDYGEGVSVLGTATMTSLVNAFRLRPLKKKMPVLYSNNLFCTCPFCAELTHGARTIKTYKIQESKTRELHMK